jgi:hypothetical protein
MTKTPKYRPALRMAIHNERDAHENIEAWYVAKGSVNLSEKHDEIRLRMDSAYMMFLRDKDAAFDRAATITKHAELWEQSEIQSRRDLDAAMDLFGRMDQQNRTTHRAISIEMALKTYRMAEKLGELSEMNRANKLYNEATGVDKDDPNVPKADDYKLPIVEVADELTRLLFQKIAAVIKSGNTLDLQELRVIDLVEGIDFQMIENALID